MDHPLNPPPPKTPISVCPKWQVFCSFTPLSLLWGQGSIIPFYPVQDSILNKINYTSQTTPPAISMMHFYSFILSLLWGERRLLVTFYSVQDCSSGAIKLKLKLDCGYKKRQIYQAYFQDLLLVFFFFHDLLYRRNSKEPVLTGTYNSMRK